MNSSLAAARRSSTTRSESSFSTPLPSSWGTTATAWRRCSSRSPTLCSSLGARWWWATWSAASRACARNASTSGTTRCGYDLFFPLSFLRVSLLRRLGVPCAPPRIGLGLSGSGDDRVPVAHVLAVLRGGSHRDERHRRHALRGHCNSPLRAREPQPRLPGVCVGYIYIYIYISKALVQ